MKSNKPAGKRKESAGPKVDWKALEIVHRNAAGIDVGGSSHFVAVPADRGDEAVREFEVYTADLHALADWLPASDRIITIEDTAELRLDHAHVVRMESKLANAEGSGSLTIRDLVRTALTRAFDHDDRVTELCETRRNRRTSRSAADHGDVADRRRSGHDSASPEKLTPAQLQDLDILFLDALRHKPHPTHSTVENSLKIVERLRPQRAFFTHICHDLPHQQTNAMLPPDVRLSYDGMKLEFEI